MGARNKRKPLTPEQRKLIWSEPQSNAGVGWWSGHPERARNDKEHVREYKLKKREYHRTGQPRAVDEMMDDD